MSDTNVSAHDFGKTHVCKFPGCTNEAKSDRGPFSRCDHHRVASSEGKRGGAAANGNGTLAQRIASLSKLARDVDKLKAVAKRKTEVALAAKRKADEAERDFRTAMRAIGMSQETDS